MPLPSTPLTLNGGCNCSAIRYQIRVPVHASRPLHPASNGEVRFPVVLTDHCNDCRKATGSILPTWICVPVGMMVCKLELVRVSPRTGEEDEDGGTVKGKGGGGDGDGDGEGREDDSDGDEEEAWLPVSSAFYPNPPSASSSSNFLRFFKSSEHVTRSFCGRCGTNLTYSIATGMGDGWPVLFDVLLGTLDRADLEREWMAPERHCWVECGIGWIERLTDGVPTMPRHEGADLSVRVG